MAGGDKTVFLCPFDDCWVESNVSATELYNAKKHNKKALASCCICGRASPLDLGEIPECGTLEVEDWSEQLAYDGETNWLPCLDPETPEWDLVAGVYVGPGNEMSPRMWLFKHAASKSSPSGRQFWTFDEWVTQFKVDPFLQLYNRRMQTNPGWLSFFTRGRAKTLEDMHLRTRVIGIGKKR